MPYVLFYKNNNYESTMLQAKTLDKLNEKIREQVESGELDGVTWEDTEQMLFSVENDVLTQEHDWTTQLLPQITLD